MLNTVIGALLPIIVILLLGFFSGWHKDFDGAQAAILNRVVMLYALPLLLFAGTVTVRRAVLVQDVPLALWIVGGMLASYFVVFSLAHWVFKRDLGTSSLQALAISGPSAPQIGVYVLGHLFDPQSTSIPVVSASLAMTLVQIPICLMLLSIGSSRGTEGGGPIAALFRHVFSAVREPMVWAPVCAIILVVAGVRLPRSVVQAMLLLGNATSGISLFAAGIVLFSRRVSINSIVVMNTLARNVVVPALFWGALAVAGLAAAVTREAVVTMAIPTTSLAVILAVQFKTAEREMASTLLFSTVTSVLTMGSFIWITG
jgi:malonate transporter and related proteins